MKMPMKAEVNYPLIHTPSTVIFLRNGGSWKYIKYLILSNRIPDLTLEGKPKELCP
jgi:hypothetical protein